MSSLLLLLSLLQPAAIDSQRQASIIARIVSYDNTLAERADETVDVSIYYKKGGKDDASLLLDGFSKLGDVKISGKRLQVKLEEWTGQTLSASLDVAIVCGSLDGDLDAFVAKSQGRRMMTVGRSRTDAQKLAVAVVVDGEQAKILVNANNIKSARLELNSALYRVAEVL